LHNFDTTSGVRVHFADTSKYESFIEVLDFCSQQDALIYAPYENNFWIFNRFKNEEEKNYRPFGSCIPLSDRYIVEENDNAAWSYADVLDKKLWPLAVLFALLVGVSFRKWQE
jgi:hypothetical protein